MFRTVRRDTLALTIESRYGISLNCRADTKIGNLLDRRGFDSVTQLVAASRGQLTSHPRRRRVFLSFHVQDLRQVQGFRLMALNPRVALDVADESLLVPIESDRAPYVRQVLQEKIRNAEVVCCLVGNATAWREWVEWEIQTAHRHRVGICAVRLKDSRGQAPASLRDLDIAVTPWDPVAIVSAIERAAATRS